MLPFKLLIKPGYLMIADPNFGKKKAKKMKMEINKWSGGQKRKSGDENDSEDHPAE